MKKKEYIDAINEIEVDKNLKIKTLEKVTQKIYAEIHKGDDGIPRTPNQQRGSVSAVQKFIGEGQLEQLAQREIDRHTA